MASQPLMIQLTTTPPVEGLYFRSLSGVEEVSRLFEYQVVVITEDSALDLSGLLGKPAAVSVEVAEDQLRWFHGIVSAAAFHGIEGRHFAYRLTLRPFLWLYTRHAILRFYEDKDVKEILQDALAFFSSNIDYQLTKTYPKRTYCVQYRETTFNFVSRLMEEEGIFYFFRHTEDQHQMVIADSPAVFEASEGFEEVSFLEDDAEQLEDTALTTWQVRNEIQTGTVILRDYNFETPSADLKSFASTSIRTHTHHEHNVYDYPGLYADKARGDVITQIRLEEQESLFARVTASGNHPMLVTGCRFTLADHPRDDQNIEYIILSTRIDMNQAGYESGVGGDTLFACQITALDSSQPYRPARTTRKAVVMGPHTAKVVGDDGQQPGDLSTDKYGRVRVQMHWNHEPDNLHSCWMRITSGWAGNGWGMISLPRIGQEVVVDFLEGDPDRPLITGRVYNAEQMPPYELPANATVSTIKSRTLQGGANDFNELRFEDKAGHEMVYLQAQKDLRELVKNSRWAHIKANEHVTVGGARTEYVGGDEHHFVKGTMLEKIEGKFGLKVKGGVLMKCDSAWAMVVKDDLRVKCGADVGFKVTGKVQIKSSDLLTDAEQSVHIKAGMSMILEAGMQISLKVGGNFVDISSAGVSITGSPMVMINSGGAAGSGVDASPPDPDDPDDAQNAELPQDPLSHF